MKRNEKIEKLERLGIFNQWKYNTERANETFNICLLYTSDAADE